MKNYRAEILSLQAMIDLERKATKNQTVSYSKEIKREVVGLFHRLQCQSKVARELNIPQTTISRWVRESSKSVVAPRKLVIVEPTKLEAAEAVTQDILHFDAVLPNGILLKGLRFDATSLRLMALG